MSEASASLGEDLASRLRRALAENEGGILEDIARRHDASYRDVLDALAPAAAARAPGHRFETVWADLAAWPGLVTFIVHTRDGVFETRGAVPAGSAGRGFFNVHGESPFGGHIRHERCAAIYAIDRPFFGRRSCSVQFVSVDGDAMLKVFVGRDATRELDRAQVERFERLFALMPTLG